MDRIFANTLRHFREEAELSQVETSMLSGISQSELSKLEDGSRWPRKKTIFRLCRVFGISTKEFFRYMRDDMGYQLDFWIEPEEDDYAE